MAGGLIDPNLSFAWTCQQAAGSTNLYGNAGLGYGSVPAVTGAPVAFGTAPNTGAGGGQALAGTGPYVGYGPFGVAGNANAPALTNAGYADQYAPFLGSLTTTTQPVLPTIALAARVSNPSGLAALVTLAGGTTTAIWVGPSGVGGTGTTNLTQVGTTTPATVTVPPGGVIYVAGSVAPTSWTWITQN